MQGKLLIYTEAVRLLLLVSLFFVAVQTAHAGFSPGNTYGLSVDYTGSAAAGSLRVKLRDAILGGGLAGIRIVAFEIRADGLAYGAGEQTTDSNGLAVFSLKRLGSGGRYYLAAFAWHDQPVFTQTLTAAGTIAWKTGRVRVRVQNATLAVPAPLAGYEVRLRRRDGSWVRWLTTDSQGVLRLDPPGVDKGIPYELTAISPLGGYRETSNVINAAGTYTFKVGNRPLVVTLRRAISNTVLAGKKVIVQKRLADGSDVRAAAGTTDNAGRVVFELDSLGRGGRFFLRANPFGLLRWLDSELITETGGYTFRVGNTPVTLIDDVSGNRLAGKKLAAFTVAADKSQNWYQAGQTNASGTVLFDFPEVSNGTVFVVRADDPFANGEYFFSTLIREQGPLPLRVRKGASERPDRIDPLVSISSPVPGKAAAAGGFMLQGRASDDREIDRVVIEIRNGDKRLEAEAWYNPAYDRWFFNVGADMLVAGSRAIITATAIDTTNNRQASTVSYPVINDNQAPTLGVFSHKDGAVVPIEGFTLKGTVTDNVAVSLLRVSVEDSNGGQLVPPAEVRRLPGSRRWAHNLFPRRWTGGVPARIVVAAEDENGNRKELAIDVTPQVTSRNHRRMIDRITFGTTAALVQQSRSMGWGSFLETQLAPEQIDDSVLESMLASTSVIYRDDLVWRTLQRMLYSERQLLELMTWFWDNHFNTDMRNVRHEYRENEAFRQHALGRFRDLLGVSAKSPAMLQYLDSQRNHKWSPNENYARELMELHTLGIDGGYTQQDVEELARVFTGWRVDENDRFYFRATFHDTGDKQFLGTLIAGGGVEEGEQALDMLASHPSTARFICGKLVRFFVSDAADSGLVSACATTFGNTNGDIGAVLRRILKSQPFYAAVANNTRFKSPLRYTTGIVRALGIPAQRRTLIPALERMGMALYRNPVPTGWPVAGDSWINADQLVQRINLLVDLFDDLQDTTGFSLLDTALAENRVTGAGILGMFMDDFFARRMTYQEYRQASVKLNIPDVFSIDAVDAEDRLRQTLRTMLAFPASHVY